MSKQLSVVPLRGGFGNQLFCWAYGVNLQSKGHKVYFDTGSDLGRGFALEGLIGRPQTVELPGLIWRRMGSSSPIWEMLPFVDRIIEDEKLPPVKRVPNRKLSLHWGYWQSHDYFSDITSTVDDELKSWLDLDSVALLPSCGVHVRRGDYVSDTGAAETLGTQPLAYYRSAMARMKERGIDRFVVYTDDREWVANNLLAENVQLAPEGSATSDFLGLASSKAVVMSNSSFSWWAAFLASRRGVEILGPANWFNSERNNSSRLMMEGWERL